ncbi:MAG TPA: hypothetical protein VFW00_05490 [Rhodocyclaceae bacterium]|nr:hypothetical protein [Rhodocyclaceae bacterium]
MPPLDELEDELEELEELEEELLDEELDDELDDELELLEEPELDELLEELLDELEPAVGLYEHQVELLGAPGKLASEQVKLPVLVTFGANTPDLPMVVSCVPLMVQVPPGCAHLVQPDGASAAAKAPLDKTSASAPRTNLNFIFVSVDFWYAEHCMTKRT